MIIETKNTCGGHPRIDGTRIEVFNIIGCLADGMRIEEIAEDYNLTVQQVKESIDWTREYLIAQYDRE